MLDSAVPQRILIKIFPEVDGKLWKYSKQRNNKTEIVIQGSNMESSLEDVQENGNTERRENSSVTAMVIQVTRWEMEALISKW